MAAKLLSAQDLVLRPVADLSLQRDTFLIQRSTVALSSAGDMLKSAILAVAAGTVSGPTARSDRQIVASPSND